MPADVVYDETDFLCTERPVSGETDSTDSDQNTLSLSTPVVTTAGLLLLGGAGRVALQHVPSVETVLPVAIAVGFFYSGRHGFGAGVAGFFFTNFIVWGAQGPWTVFQCLGAGMAGASAGLTGRVTRRRSAFFAALILGGVLYEVVINLGSILYTPWALAMGATYWTAAVPYGAVHIATTFGAGSILYAFNAQIRALYEQGRLEVSWDRYRSALRGHRGTVRR